MDKTCIFNNFFTEFEYFEQKWRYLQIKIYKKFQNRNFELMKPFFDFWPTEWDRIQKNVALIKNFDFEIIIYFDIILMFRIC